MIPRLKPPGGSPSERARRLSTGRPRGRRGVALAIVATLAVAACGHTAPTPSASSSAVPSGQTPGPSASPVDLPALYASIEEQVRAIRGLEAKTPVDPIVLDDAGIKKLVQDSFKEDKPDANIAANERMLKLMGLLTPDASLKDLYVELLGSQVAGLYNPEDKHLYVVSKSGRLGPTEKTTFAHEYTHALQDQNFDLSGLQLDQIGEGDRALARLALVEGDATLLMSLWQLQHLSQAEIIELLGESLDPEATRVLNEMPPVLRESLFFPYTSGLTFVQGLQAGGDWAAVNDAFDNPPATTEQVLHPEKYASHEAQTPVDLPDDLAARLGAGWSVGLEDTLGEFQIKLWLANAAGGEGTNQAEAATGAAGWGGDRSAILDGPNDSGAVVIATIWDSPADAKEFAAQAALVVGSLDHPGSVLAPIGGRIATVVIGSSREIVQLVENVLGLAG